MAPEGTLQRIPHKVEEGGARAHEVTKEIVASLGLDLGVNLETILKKSNSPPEEAISAFIKEMAKKKGLVVGGIITNSEKDGTATMSIKFEKGPEVFYLNIRIPPNTEKKIEVFLSDENFYVDSIIKVKGRNIEVHEASNKA